MRLLKARKVAGREWARGVRREVRWDWTSLMEDSIAMRWLTIAYTLSGRAFTLTQFLLSDCRGQVRGRETFDASVDDVHGLTCAHEVSLRRDFSEFANDAFHGFLGLAFIVSAGAENIVFEGCGHICRMCR